MSRCSLDSTTRGEPREIENKKGGEDGSGCQDGSCCSSSSFPSFFVFLARSLVSTLTRGFENAASQGGERKILYNFGWYKAI